MEQQNAQLVAVLESITDGFFVMDRHWIVKYWNKQAELLLQKSRQQMLGASLQDYYPEEVAGGFYQRYRQALETQKSVRFEEYLHRSGHWYEVTAYPSADQLSIYFKDITDKKRHEQALLESEESYRQLFNNAPLPQFIYDRRTLRFLKVNQAALLTYGYTEEEFLQISALELRPEEERAKFLDHIQTWKQEACPYTTVWQHRIKSGERITVEVAASRIVYRGQPAILATMNNITEKIRLEEKIVRLKALRQRKIMEATVGAQERERAAIGRELHDNINQILTTTNMFLELAEENEALCLEMIARSRDNLSHAIREIRALSRELTTSTLEDIGLSNAVRELAENYRRASRFHLQVACDGQLDHIGMDVQVALFRIIQEQLNNIVKHAEAKNVGIKLRFGGREIRLQVRDDGKGFDTRLPRQGLGIRNMQNRAELHNGRLRLTSAEGKGCTLDVHIPWKACVDEHSIVK
ncbi:PAS domain S-box protein [Paraflavisolibacter sp. H34]|uniref:PAS domain-containing sensor histidine kinase n=1 Tax=Huijunlia imazamoxiresistens TaxID=3127457 RepID=UPI0030186567